MADEPTSLPFELKAGTPVRIRFTATDGKRYEMSLGAIVLDVLDHGPAKPPEQRFTVQLNWQTHTKSG